MANEKHNLITWLGFTTEPDFSKARLLGHAIGYGFVALYVCVFTLLVGGLMWTISHVPDIIDDVIVWRWNHRNPVRQVVRQWTTKAAFDRKKSTTIWHPIPVVDPMRVLLQGAGG